MHWSIDVTPPKPPKPRRGRDPHGFAAYALENWTVHYANVQTEDSRKAVEECLAAMAGVGNGGADADDDPPDARAAWKLAVRPWPVGGWKIAGPEVASLSFKSTPIALYRLLYLCAPSKLDLSDMYKTGAGFICLTSPCRRFAVRFELWKYELAARFYVAKDLAKRVARDPAIEYGGPAVRKGRITKNETQTTECEDAWRFFEMVRMALSRKWMVYGGNDFEV